MGNLATEGIKAFHEIGNTVKSQEEVIASVSQKIENLMIVIRGEDVWQSSSGLAQDLPTSSCHLREKIRY